MIVAAPLMDIGARSFVGWGEPDFPSEEEF